MVINNVAMRPHVHELLQICHRNTADETSEIFVSGVVEIWMRPQSRMIRIFIIEDNTFRKSIRNGDTQLNDRHLAIHLRDRNEALH